MFTNYGCVTTKWFPVKSHGPLVASDLANSLAPLQPYVGKVLIPRGIRAMNEWTQYNKGPGRGLGQGNDSHLQAAGSYFTLQPVSPNSNDPFLFRDEHQVHRQARSAPRSITSWRSSSAHPGCRFSCGLATPESVETRRAFPT